MDSSSSDDLEDHLEVKHFYRKRDERYYKHNLARRNIRLKQRESSNYDPFIQMETKPKIVQNYKSLNIDSPIIADLSSTPVTNEESLSVEPVERFVDPGYVYEQQSSESTIFDDSEKEEPYSNVDAHPLWVTSKIHDYTSIRTFDFCQEFMALARRGSLCKLLTDEFLKFIKFSMPFPNQIPTTEAELNMLLNVEILFTKRSVCLRCLNEIYSEEFDCSYCLKKDVNSIAHV